MNVHTKLSGRAHLLGTTAAIWLGNPSCLDKAGDVCFRVQDSLLVATIFLVVVWEEELAATIFLLPI